MEVDAIVRCTELNPVDLPGGLQTQGSVNRVSVLRLMSVLCKTVEVAYLGRLYRRGWCAETTPAGMAWAVKFHSERYRALPRVCGAQNIGR